MADRPELENTIHARRQRRGWSQDELARRAGLSRAGVSAIENGRLVPSTAAALALAAAFECRVEDLFQLPGARPAGPDWAWTPTRWPCRYWAAALPGGIRLFPVEGSPLGVILHDGIAERASAPGPGNAEPERTLVLASCDPAVGLLAEALQRAAGVRLIVIPRPSRAALALLRQGLVHAAGIHLGAASGREGNAQAVRDELGPGYSLLRAAEWEEGIALAPARGVATVGAAVRAGLRWVGREPGSGARQCLDELLGGRAPRRLASDHRGVAEAVRSGWADAGVCLRLVSEEARLDFLAIRRERYDLCLPDSWRSDDRLRALVAAVRSAGYRRALAELPGYDSAAAGELERVV